MVSYYWSFTFYNLLNYYCKSQLIILYLFLHRLTYFFRLIFFNNYKFFVIMFFDLNSTMLVSQIFF